MYRTKLVRMIFFSELAKEEDIQNNPAEYMVLPREGFTLQF